MTNLCDKKGKDRSKTDSAIIRYFDREVFEDQNIRMCLSKLAELVNKEDIKWHMEFRGNVESRNRVDLYCKGLTLSIKFYKNKRLFTASMDENLKRELEKIDAGLLKFFKGSQPIDLFENFISALPVLQKAFEEYPSIQNERMMEWLLAKELNNTEEMFIADIEVVASKTRDYWYGEKDEKRKNPEGDLLVLLRRGDKYNFLPVELKLADAKHSVLDDAENEIRTFLNVIYGGINNLSGLFDCFKTNYENICSNKVQIGLLKHGGGEIKILDDRDSMKIGLILVLESKYASVTKHKLTSIESNKPVKISGDSEPFLIYALKCTMEEFVSNNWKKGLKL